jgi:acetate kinase
VSGSRVLVVNAGSSSLKYRLLDVATGSTVASGLVSEIGGRSHWRHQGDPDRDEDIRCADHAAAFALARQALGGGDGLGELVGVGHRVVHGGSRFTAPTPVDDDVLAALDALAPLAPLHNPANAEGIRRAGEAFPGVPSVAVFDTAFHRTIPVEAHTYAVPNAWREAHDVRRFGFHGTSYAYVSRRTARRMGRRVEDLRMVVLHLGNGASACAVDGGRSVETSMGLTPTEGLVMGTRSGDVDPSLGGYLARVAGLDAERYDHALNRESGLLGLCGASDFRTVLDRVDAGDEDARLALDATVHRIVKYVGAYAAVLGRVDALVFTGGIGERGAPLRTAVLGRLGLLGVRVDEAANAAGEPERRISTTDSPVEVWVVPTDEEREIARETLRVLGADTEW